MAAVMMSVTSGAVDVDNQHDIITLDVDNSASYYSKDVRTIRQQEYPAIEGTTYLDHAGTTLYPKSMIESYTTELTSNLFGNPHSASASSQLSSRRVEDIRLQVLRFVNADPKDFEVVFVANATAAIKMVGDALRDHNDGFWYGYHSDSHTSLVGVRELARQGSRCFQDDDAVSDWMAGLQNQQVSRNRIMLFAYPGQSNMTGRRLPDNWCGQIRSTVGTTGHQIYSLLDAAALASTSPLDFSDANIAPDFTSLSFYKIFGFPDLGALIVRKASGDILRQRKYFAGGTVDMVSTCHDESWHMKRECLHSALEDGTLPFHNIIALEHAFKAHLRLYGSMKNIANHTASLCSILYQRMSMLRHANGAAVCRIHGRDSTISSRHGPVIAFNLLDTHGKYISNTEVEKLGIVRNIQFRTGGLCNPGGIANYLGVTAEEMKRNYAAGQRCGGENDMMNGKPTGTIRVSFGAMSNHADIDRFVDFLEEFYVSRTIPPMPITTSHPIRKSHFYIESMSIFPIKSCSAFSIPPNVNWDVTSKGLAWDREWCLVHMGTNVALSQKQYPRMALIKPAIDMQHRTLTMSFCNASEKKTICVGLDDFPSAMGSFKACRQFKESQSLVCGESVPVYIYTLPELNDFFSNILGVPCALARYFHHDATLRSARLRKPRSKLSASAENPVTYPSINLANESPILLVSRSSINRLNEQIRQFRSHPQEILPESFRANIIVSENTTDKEPESPYTEDSWRGLGVASGSKESTFKVLGPCQRCQMVCIDQSSAKRMQEPFSTLAKTRRWDGGVWFGIHLYLEESREALLSTLRVGDIVSPSY